MPPLTTITIEAPLRERRPVDADDVDVANVVTSEIRPVVDTYHLCVKVKDIERSLRLTEAAVSAMYRPFEELLPEAVREEYAINPREFDVTVSPPPKTVTAAAAVEAYDSVLSDRSVFAILRSWEDDDRSYLDDGTVSTTIDYHHDFGDHDMGGLDREAAVAWLREQFNDE